MRFQSRYRAASHFRFASGWHGAADLLIVSISLSSGFSFQVQLIIPRLPLAVVSISLSSGFSFQGGLADIAELHLESFNLVIERLLISGEFGHRLPKTPHNCFNLVIERLLISGAPSMTCPSSIPEVSISLSSGFSFQVARSYIDTQSLLLFQSRYRAASHFR